MSGGGGDRTGLTPSEGPGTRLEDVPRRTYDACSEGLREASVGVHVPSTHVTAQHTTGCVRPAGPSQPIPVFCESRPQATWTHQAGGVLPGILWSCSVGTQVSGTHLFDLILSRCFYSSNGA